MSVDRIRSLLLGSRLRIAVTVVVSLVVLVALAFLVGLVGVPTVESVDNAFGDVNESTTVIRTDLRVRNPNPIGVSLGGTTVNYSVQMNDVRLASGQKEGLALDTGTTPLPFTTRMRNEQIPKWWVTHVRNGETTNVLVDARVRSSLLGGRTVELPQERTVETDLIGNFNSEETRRIDAGRTVPSDPVLYVNETSAAWDRGNVTAERTPMDMSFTVYNPKPYPYAVTEIGYEIRLNGVLVGEGSSEDVATVAPGSTATVDTRTAIVNSNLDEWWVSHLERNQVSDLEIDFYAVVDPVEGDGALGGLDRTVPELRLPLEPLDYEKRIETDIFDSKNGSADGSAGDGTDGDATTTDGAGGDTRAETSTPASSDSPTPTDAPTATDDGGLLGGGDTAAPTDSPTPAPTPTRTPTDDGAPAPTDSPTPTDAPTTTDDGGLLG